MGDGLDQHVIGILVATMSTAMGVVSMGDVLRCRRNRSLGKVAGFRVRVQGSGFRFRVQGSPQQEPGKGGARPS